MFICVYPVLLNHCRSLSYFGADMNFFVYFMIDFIGARNNEARKHGPSFGIWTKSPESSLEQRKTKKITRNFSFQLFIDCKHRNYKVKYLIGCYSLKLCFTTDLTVATKRGFHEDWFPGKLRKETNNVHLWITPPFPYQLPAHHIFSCR